ncbi:MAG: hypothetical protein H6Q89_1643, partial [Myxococcaceae bacterium]|nr:hypothetical protein [Myxococcaceae bacterium]
AGPGRGDPEPVTMTTFSRRGIVLVLALLGCGRTLTHEVRQPCVFDRECPTGLRCVDQLCRVLDEGDGGKFRGALRFGQRCDAGSQCESDRCVGGPTGPFCTRDCDDALAACPDSYTCKQVASESLCAVAQPALPVRRDAQRRQAVHPPGQDLRLPPRDARVAEVLPRSAQRVRRLPRQSDLPGRWRLHRLRRSGRAAGDVQRGGRRLQLGDRRLCASHLHPHHQRPHLHRPPALPGDGGVGLRRSRAGGRGLQSAGR